jgi:hypothetical protein
MNYTRTILGLTTSPDGISWTNRGTITNLAQPGSYGGRFDWSPEQGIIVANGGVNSTSISTTNGSGILNQSAQVFLGAKTFLSTLTTATVSATVVTASDTTESTTSSTGALKSSGGIAAVKNIVGGGQVASERNAAGNSGASLTIDWNNGNMQTVTMTATCGFTFSNPIAGGMYMLVLTQGGSGSYTVTWPGGIKWPGGTPPTLSTAVAAIDVITFGYDGTSYYGNFNTAFA